MCTHVFVTIYINKQINCILKIKNQIRQTVLRFKDIVNQSTAAMCGVKIDWKNEPAQIYSSVHINRKV